MKGFQLMNFLSVILVIKVIEILIDLISFLLIKWFLRNLCSNLSYEIRTVSIEDHYFKLILYKLKVLLIKQLFMD
jgi:hypothetical protein